MRASPSSTLCDFFDPSKLLLTGVPIRPYRSFLFLEFFSDAFANKFRYRLASLPAHYRKDSRNIVVQIELCSFHRDVYYTSRCQIAR